MDASTDSTFPNGFGNAPSASRFPAPYLWFAMLIMALCAARVLLTITAHGFVAVPDDQIQHVVPFTYFLPGAAYPPDAIADYFIHENSPVYRAIFRTFAEAGIHPSLVAWSIGIASGLLTLWGLHAAVRAAGLPAEVAGATVILALLFLLWRDDLAVGAARAVGWPVVALGLWALAADRRLALALVLCAGALIYPATTVLMIGAAGLLALWDAVRGRSLAPLLRWTAPLLAPLLLTAALWLGPSPGGGIVPADLARRLPEFQENGRTPVFFASPIRYWLTGKQTGLLDFGLARAWFLPPLALAGLLLGRRDARLMRLVLPLAAASIILWAAAHLLLFRLYLPARYASYGLGTCAIILAGHGAATLAGRLRHGVPVAAGLLLLYLPLALSGRAGPDEAMPQFALRLPQAPGLMRHIAASPERGIVAGVARELDRVPAFTGRPVWWSWETAVTFRLGYRALVAGRLVTATQMTFAPEPRSLLDWTTRENIAFLLVEDRFLRPGPMPYMVGRSPGGESPLIPARASWPDAWLARQDQCRRSENGISLFDVACLRASTARPAG